MEEKLGKILEPFTGKYWRDIAVKRVLDYIEGEMIEDATTDIEIHTLPKL